MTKKNVFDIRDRRRQFSSVQVDAGVAGAGQFSSSRATCIHMHRARGAEFVDAPGEACYITQCSVSRVGVGTRDEQVRVIKRLP